MRAASESCEDVAFVRRRGAGLLGVRRLRFLSDDGLWRLGGSLGALDARALTAGGASTSAGATGASPGDGAAEAVVMVAMAQAAALERAVNTTSTLAHQVDRLVSGGGSSEEGFGLDGNRPLTHPLTAR